MGSLAGPLLVGFRFYCRTITPALCSLSSAEDPDWLRITTPLKAPRRRRCLVPFDNFCGWKKTPTGKHHNDAQRAVLRAAQPDAGLDTGFRGAINAIAEWK